MPELVAPRPGLDTALAGRIDWKDDAAAALILANPEWVARSGEAAGLARRLLPELAGHVFVATSGTSRGEGAQPRWVALSRRAVRASAAAVNLHLRAEAGDVWAHALPLFHVGGLGILARAQLSGARVEDAAGGSWDPERFLRRAAECRATLGALVPTQVHDLVTAGLKAPRTLRAIVIGGGRMDPALYREARALGWPCLPSYGLTETASQVATAPLESLAETHCPTALPMLAHAEARVDRDGVVWVRGASLLTCYVEIENGRARAWDPRAADGWFRTGDLGVMHAGGLEVRGRGADTVKVLGELVWLPRVEAEAARWLAQEPMLRGMRVDLAVAAVPHPRLGHELVLAVSPAAGGSELPSTDLLLASLRRFQAAALPVERVRRLEVVETIPRTALGKCRRELLASRLSRPAATRDVP
ncbi:MAG TPA: AMP-binding protein [Vicinamibacterales bacterium]|nr:AMP-binding protein [Acidobacteriota bacterium]HOC16970.1 AMP-binding protein [Vicinamibacterales bacterium]